MLNVEIRIIDKWTNQTNFWFAGKYCQIHVTKVTRYFRPLCRNSIARGSELAVPVEFEVYNFT